MNISSRLDQIHLKARQNRWLWYFTIFTRVMLALGFLPSGFVKVNGERFTALDTLHPMGSYLEAFYHTGFYYTFVGMMQMLAAILLLIPRTATLGALIYFPIILNICLLSIAVKFDGSLLSSPLMLIACLYLLCWDWHKLKFIFFPKAEKSVLPAKNELSNRFPFRFFAGSAATVFTVIVLMVYMSFFTFMPRNELSRCSEQCPDTDNPEACLELCDCLHTSRSYNHCFQNYEGASNAHSEKNLGLKYD
jgi:uncharacterized membrane protein YphA (DoxX/SURF4 family)